MPRRSGLGGLDRLGLPPVVLGSEIVLQGGMKHPPFVHEVLCSIPNISDAGI